MVVDDDDDDGISSNFYFRWIRKFIILKKPKFTTPKMKQQNKVYTHSRKTEEKKRINHERWERKMRCDEINTQINTNKLSSDLFMIRAHSQQHHEKSRPENSRLFNDAHLMFFSNFYSSFVWLLDFFSHLSISLFFFLSLVLFRFFLLITAKCFATWIRMNFLSRCVSVLCRCEISWAAMIKIAISAIYARRTWTRWIKLFLFFAEQVRIDSVVSVYIYLFVFSFICSFAHFP